MTSSLTFKGKEYSPHATNKMSADGNYTDARPRICTRTHWISYRKKLVSLFVAAAAAAAVAVDEAWSEMMQTPMSDGHSTNALPFGPLSKVIWVCGGAKNPFKSKKRPGSEQ
jgi:hypothetical protein